VRCLIEIKSKEIKIVPIEKLTPNPKNENVHSDKQIEVLAKIIDANGFRIPLVVSNRSGYIESGCGRYAAAKLREWDELPVIYQDFENEAEETRHRLADNEIARHAQLDESKMLDNLKDLDFDLDTFDFSEIGLLDFELPQVEVVGECDEDEIPEVKNDPVTIRGDVWLLGDHRLKCGDSTMVDDVEDLMNSEKADMVFTDPPYGYSYESNYQSKHEELKNDDKILDFLPIASANMSHDSTIYLCGSHQTIDKWKPLVEDSFNYKNMIVWKKNNWSMGDLKGAFAGQHELIIFASKGKNTIIGKRDTDVWSFDRVPPEKHPTMKPVDLIEYALSKWQSGKVLDLFLGSGSTLIACHKTGRRCFGMEISEHYCDVIIQRFQKFSGKEAKLESTGKTYNELLALKEDSIPRSC